MLASFFDTERECIQIDLVMGEARTLEFLVRDATAKIPVVKCNEGWF